MNDFNREDLIRQLATAKGITNKKYDASRYDSSTGTIYCNGHAISKNMIEQAKQFFETQRKQYQQLSDAEGAYEMATFFEVGIEAITMLQNNSDIIQNGGKMVVKENE